MEFAFRPEETRDDYVLGAYDSEVVDAQAITAPDDSHEHPTEAGEPEVVHNLDISVQDAKERMLTAYEDFKPVVATLREELSELADPEDHPGYLRSGLNATTFKVEVDGKQYAVRLMASQSTQEKAVDSIVTAAPLGWGNPHLEQIHAASYEEGATVAAIMPGKKIGKLTPADVDTVTDAHLADLIDTIKDTDRRKIKIDPKPSNVLYDRQAGFGIIDYSSLEDCPPEVQEEVSIGATVGLMAEEIEVAGYESRVRELLTTPEAYAHALGAKQTNLGVLQRFRSIVLERLADDGPELRIALEKIDRVLDKTRDSIANYADPEWVAGQLAADEARRQRVAAMKAAWVAGQRGHDRALDVL